MEEPGLFVRRWKSLAESERDEAMARRGRFVGAVCWSWLKRRDGTCLCTDGRKEEEKGAAGENTEGIQGEVPKLIHLGSMGQTFPCAQHINALLGNGRPCTEGSKRCSGEHWALEILQEALGSEDRRDASGPRSEEAERKSEEANGHSEETSGKREETNGLAKPDPQIRNAVLSHTQAERLGTRSAASAAGEIASERTEVDGPRLGRILVADAARLNNPYLSRFCQEPWLQEFLADPRLAALLSTKHRSKEISEAYSVASRVEAMLRELELASDGAGAVLLDMCSGKGITGVILSFIFPRAEVVLADANGHMDLAHCAARDNLSFWHLDLFSSQVGEAMAQIIRGRVAIAAGMHLCGALSPRLIDVFAGVRDIHAMVLCPCCLKGSLGKAVKHAAKREGRRIEELLTATLADAARKLLVESGHVGDNVREEEDEAMLSPKRRIVIAWKPRGLGALSVPDPAQ